jgi:hypothetical protein
MKSLERPEEYFPRGGRQDVPLYKQKTFAVSETLILFDSEPSFPIALQIFCHDINPLKSKSQNYPLSTP